MGKALRTRTPQRGLHRVITLLQEITLHTVHFDWSILPLMLPTPPIWILLDRERRSPNCSRKIMEMFDSSNSGSVALMILLTTPIINFH